MSKLNERSQGIVFRYFTWIISFILFFVMMGVALPLEFLCSQGFSDQNIDWVMDQYVPAVWASSGLFIFETFIYWLQDIFKGVSMCTLIPVLPFFAFYGFYHLFDHLNPFSMIPFTHGRARRAKWEDVKEMGLLKGFIFVLGKFKGHFLRLNETLSVLATAPPGTGKTTAIVVPTILDGDGISMIVNDPKPEICFQTSAYRSKQGPVYIINWGGEDDPDNNIFWPSWNPLSPVSIPEPGAERDLYIDVISNIFVQEKKNSSADPHWTKTGRNALTGLIHFVVNKCEKARANDYFKKRFKEGAFNSEDAYILESYYMEMKDPIALGALNLLRQGKLNAANYVPIGSWEDLPDQWVGHEACMAMIVDWMTESQLKMAEEVNKRKRQGDQMAGLSDIMKELFQNAARESKKYGYSHRAVQEMTKLANTPDKERGSIISTVDAGIGIFKNQAVRQRTSTTDFTFRDLRGMVDPKDGKMKPVTVYLSINENDSEALGPISGVFIDLMSRYLIAHKPDAVTRDGTKVGPYPVMFVLDEFPAMPKLDAVISGPARGRGQKVSYLLIAQDLEQISAGYGSEYVEIILSTTAAKIVLTQANDKTADRFANMLAKTTNIDKSFEGGDINKVFGTSVVEKTKVDDTFSKNNILTLEKGKQIVMIQGKTDRPILADSPAWYNEPDMKKKVAMGTSTYIPEWLHNKRKKEYEKIMAKRRAELGLEEDADIEEAEVLSEVHENTAEAEKKPHKTEQ
jgi:type IV secretion system protein VirD4